MNRQLLWIAAAIVPVAGPAHAQTVQAQLRFAIAPGAADPAWKTPRIKFEKRGQCARLTTAPVAKWPPVTQTLAGKGEATAPLFNPGFPNPDGSYKPGTQDDSFNTLFMALTSNGLGKSIVCRGTILANGVDVTLRDGSDISARTNESVGSLGPMGVAPKLDRRKLAGLAYGRETPPAPSPIQGIYKPIERKGAVTIKWNDQFDFDTGKAGKKGDPGMDFVFDAPYYPSIQWSWVSPAVFKLWVDKAPSYTECVDSPYAVSVAVSAPKYIEGKWQCVRTSEGRMGRFWFTGLVIGAGATAADPKASVTLHYEVWAK